MTPWARILTLPTTATTMTHSDAPSLAPPAPAYSPLSGHLASSTQTAQSDWTLAQLLGFRTLLVYVVLYTFPGPINELPGTDFLSDPYAALCRVVVPWFGAHVLHLSHPELVRRPQQR